MRRSGLLVWLAAVACAADGSSGSSETTTTSGTSSTSAVDPSSGADSSTGGIPDACPDVAVQTGIVGRTDRRTCDFLADCVMPESGVEVYAYTGNPQVGGSATMPGTLDTSMMALEDLHTGVGGRFEFQIPAGTYHVCAASDDGGVLCSDPITLSDDDPVAFASYERGTAYKWSVISCGL